MTRINRGDKLVNRGDKLEDFAPVYYCPKCEARYTTQIEAVHCSKSDEAPIYKPGDIVLIDIGYAWFDGDPKWLKEIKPSKHGERPEYALYFVVTSVDHKDHRVRYSVKSLGVINGHTSPEWTSKPGIFGYTTPTHYVGELIADRPDLAEEGAQFIGEQYVELI